MKCTTQYFSNIFTMVCNYHYLNPSIYTKPKTNLLLPIPSSPSSQKPLVYFKLLWLWLLWTSHIHEIIYVTFISQIFHLELFSRFIHIVTCISISLMAQMVKNPPVIQGTQVWFLVQEDSLKKGMATHSIQYSCLENFMDRGDLWVTVHGVTKSRTWWSD